MKVFAQVKLREEAKRELAWAPGDRWKAIQDTITWAERQQTVRRNTPARCLHEQAHKLRRLLPAG